MSTQQIQGLDSSSTHNLTGLEVDDLRSFPAFTERRIHVRDPATQMQGMQRLTRAFLEHPETLLQELVHLAVDLCGADSAGISIETGSHDDATFYRWVATAGEYSVFQDAFLPRSPSACGICLDRGKPQHFRVSQSFFDLMGISGPLVTDGLLLPWQTEDSRGTIWIMAHDRMEAFDLEDCRIMQIFAEFAALAHRHGHQHRALVRHAASAAAVAMANTLAHEINNPLQCLTNIVYLAAEAPDGSDGKELAKQLSGDLGRLSRLVGELLALPGLGLLQQSVLPSPLPPCV